MIPCRCRTSRGGLLETIARAAHPVPFDECRLPMPGQRDLAESARKQALHSQRQNLRRHRWGRIHRASGRLHRVRRGHRRRDLRMGPTHGHLPTIIHRPVCSLGCSSHELHACKWRADSAILWSDGQCGLALALPGQVNRHRSRAASAAHWWPQNKNTLDLLRTPTQIPIRDVSRRIKFYSNGLDEHTHFAL